VEDVQLIIEQFQQIKKPVNAVVHVALPPQHSGEKPQQVVSGLYLLDNKRNVVTYWRAHAGVTWCGDSL
jgi:hypothetical protein